MKNTAIALALSGLLLVGACGGNGGRDEDAAPAETTQGAAGRFQPEKVVVLQEAAGIAYDAAAAFARGNDNYFPRTIEERGQLAGDVSIALSRANTGVGSGYVEEEELTWCSRFAPDPMVRIWASDDGREIVLAASDDEAVLTLSYAAGDEEPQYSDPEECEPLGT